MGDDCVALGNTSTIRIIAIRVLNTAQPAFAALVSRGRRPGILSILALALTLAVFLALTLLGPGDAAAQSARRVSVTSSPVCEGVPMTFTLTLPAGAAVSGQPPFAVSYNTNTNLITTNTAVSGVNFTATSGSVNFDLSDPNAQTRTVTVETLFRDNTTTDDTAADKTFTLIISYSSGNNLIQSQGKGVIKDCRNVVTLLPLNPQVPEGDDIELTITVQNIESNVDPKGIITYQVNKLTGLVSNVVRNDTAEPGTDFNFVSNAIWVPMPNADPPVLTKTFTVSTHNNDPESVRGAEGNETFSAYLYASNNGSDVKNLHLHGPNGENVATLVNTVTILDRHKSGMVVIENSDDPVYAEEGETLEFVVKNTGTGLGTVDYEVVADTDPDTSTPTATAGDYTAITGTLTVDGYNQDPTLQTISVPLTDDDLVEVTETFYLKLTNPTGQLQFSADGAVDHVQAKGGIIDNDTLKAEVADVTVVEGQEAQVTLSLERALKDGEHVAFSMVADDRAPCADPGDVAARLGVDYFPVPLSTLTMQGGEQTKTLSVGTVSDRQDEHNECFRVVTLARQGIVLEAQTGQAPVSEGGAQLYSKVVIEDDDAPPRLSFGHPEVLEPDDDETAIMRFPVSLDLPSEREASVQYREYRGGTYWDNATAGEDYKAITAGTLTFQPGQTIAFIDVTIIGDSTEEPTELVWMGYNNPQNACLNAGALCASGGRGVPGYILNDDRNVRLSFSLADPRVREGENSAFIMELSHPIGHDISVITSADSRNSTACEDGGVRQGCDTSTPNDYQYDVGTSLVRWEVAAGDTRAEATITTYEDMHAEGLEYFTLDGHKENPSQ